MRELPCAPELCAQAVSQLDNTPLVFRQADTPAVKKAVGLQEAIAKMIELDLMLR